MKDFSFDFEAVGKSPDGVVLSCAAICFDRGSINTFDEHLKNVKYWKFDIDDQVRTGRKIDKDTLTWWETKVSKVVRDSQFKPTDEDITLDVFIVELKEFLKKSGIVKGSVGYVRGNLMIFLC